LKSLGIAFTVKTVVTGDSQMSALVRYFHGLGIRKIQIGNIMDRGRCGPAGTHALDRKKFLQSYLYAFKIAERFGIEMDAIWSTTLVNMCDACRLLTVMTVGLIM